MTVHARFATLVLASALFAPAAFSAPRPERASITRRAQPVVTASDLKADAVVSTGVGGLAGIKMTYDYPRMTVSAGDGTWNVPGSLTVARADPFSYFGGAAKILADVVVTTRYDNFTTTSFAQDNRTVTLTLDRKTGVYSGTLDNMGAFLNSGGRAKGSVDRVGLSFAGHKWDSNFGQNYNLNVGGPDFGQMEAALNK